jgi:16S rRNA (adenine1518-N6/adenine1519-N6)-dimethyltransferase
MMDQEFSATPAPRPTQSYLRELFRTHQLRPKNKLGQNFLIDLNVRDFVVRMAELSRADLVLEVGTGTGGLTARLAERAGSVLSVEIDRNFHELAREALGEPAHVRLLNTDVLKNKNHLNPEVLAALEEMRQNYRPQRLKLVANLPYAVATPVISNLLLLDLPLERMVVMVQWEIAERLAARPSTKDYGALSVLIQAIADVEILRKLPPAVFWPRPQVASAVVCIRPSKEKRAHVTDLQRFRIFLRDLYAHRRKNLRGGLLGLAGRPFDKATVDAKLGALGYDGTERAETLGVEQHLQLCEAFRIGSS